MHFISSTISRVSNTAISNIRYIYSKAFGRQSTVHLNRQPHLDNIEPEKTDNKPVIKRKASDTVPDQTILSKKRRLDITQGSNDKEHQKPIQTIQKDKRDIFQINQDLPSTMDPSAPYPLIIREPKKVKFYQETASTNQSMTTTEQSIITLDDSDDEATEAAVAPSLSLEETEWLGDQDITSFKKILRRKLAPDSKDHFIFDPLFFTLLSENRNLDLAQFINAKSRAMTRSSCLDHEKLHIPIRVNKNHWILITVEKHKGEMTIYDSLNDNYGTYSHLVEHLQSFFKSYGHMINTITFDNSLKQNDGYNCGIAVLTRLFATTLLDKPYDFSHCTLDFLTTMRRKVKKALTDNNINTHHFLSPQNQEPVEIIDLT